MLALPHSHKRLVRIGIVTILFASSIAILEYTGTSGVHAPELAGQLVTNNEQYAITYYPNGLMYQVRDKQSGTLYTYYDDTYGTQPNRGRLQSIAASNGDKREFAQYWGTSTSVQVEKRWLQGKLRWRITYDSNANRTRIVGYYPSGNIERIRDYTTGAYAEFLNENSIGSTIGRRKLVIAPTGEKTEYAAYWGDTPQVRRSEYYEGNYHRSTNVFDENGNRVRTTAYFESGNIQRIQDYETGVMTVYLDEDFTGENRGRVQRYEDGASKIIFVEYWGDTDQPKEKVWFENDVETKRYWYTQSGDTERSLIDGNVEVTYYPSGNRESTYNRETEITVYYTDENIDGRGYGRVTERTNSETGITVVIDLEDGTDERTEENHYSADDELLRTTYIDAETKNVIIANWQTNVASVREPKTGETDVIHYWKDIAYEKKGRFHRIIYQDEDTELWGVETSLQEKFTNPSGEEVAINITYPRATEDMPNYTIETLLTGNTDEIAEQNFTEMQKALYKARADNVLNFLVPKGTYHFKSPEGSNANMHIRMDSFDDFVFNGQGSTFIFHDRSHGIMVNRSNRVAVRNLTVDWDQQLAFPVTIERDTRPGYEGKYVIEFINEKAYGIDRNNPPPITIASGFDVKNKRFWDDAKQFHVAFTLDENPTEHARPIPVADNEPLRYELDMSHWPEGRILGTENILTNMVGVTAVATSRENWNAFIIRESADVDLTNLTVYTAPLNGYSINVDNKNVRLADSRVMRNPNDPLRLVSVLGGATQHFATQGNNILENNTFLHMMDDGANFHGHYFEVVYTENNRTFYTEQNVTLDDGDILGIYDPDTAAKIGESVIDHTEFNVSCGAIKCSKVVLKDPIAGMKPGLLSLNLSGFSENFIFRRNVVQDCRARGVVAATHNGLIEENTFQRTTLAGVQLTHDLRTFFEGPASEDIIIANNTMTNVTLGTNERQRSDEQAGLIGAITINSHSNENLGHGFITDQMHKNIVIKRNTINGAGGYAITIGGGEGITIDQNTGYNLYKLSMPWDILTSTDPIQAIDSGVITILNNLFR